MTNPDPPILSYAYATMQDSLVRIGPFHDLVEADLAAAKLGDEGIRAALAGAAMSATLGPIYGAAYSGGGPFVLVPAADEARARSIIANVEEARRHRLASETPPCPACGGESTEQLHNLRWAGIGLIAVGVFLSRTPLILLIVVGLVMLLKPVTPVWKCRQCERRFSANRPKPSDDNEDTNTGDDVTGPPEPD